MWLLVKQWEEAWKKKEVKKSQKGSDIQIFKCTILKDVKCKKKKKTLHTILFIVSMCKSDDGESALTCHDCFAMKSGKLLFISSDSDQ